MLWPFEGSLSNRWNPVWANCLRHGFQPGSPHYQGNISKPASLRGSIALAHVTQLFRSEIETKDLQSGETGPAESFVRFTSTLSQLQFLTQKAGVIIQTAMPLRALAQSLVLFCLFVVLRDGGVGNSPVLFLFLISLLRILLHCHKLSICITAIFIILIYMQRSQFLTFLHMTEWLDPGC